MKILFNKHTYPYTCLRLIVNVSVEVWAYIVCGKCYNRVVHILTQHTHTHTQLAIYQTTSAINVCGGAARRTEKYVASKAKK